jgi:hypothetical protein
MHLLHGQLTYGLSFRSSFKPVVVLSFLSSLRKWLKWIRQAGSPARHKATCLASKLKTQGLESVLTQIPSPLVLTTMPHDAW